MALIAAGVLRYPSFGREPNKTFKCMCVARPGVAGKESTELTRALHCPDPDGTTRSLLHIGSPIESSVPAGSGRSTFQVTGPLVNWRSTHKRQSQSNGAISFRLRVKKF